MGAERDNRDARARASDTTSIDVVAIATRVVDDEVDRWKRSMSLHGKAADDTP